LSPRHEHKQGEAIITERPATDYRPAAAWGTVAILVLFQFLSLVDRQIIAILADHIKADLGLSDVELSLLQGLAFALFYSVAGLPIGIAIDRYSRRWILWIAISFWSLSSAACGLASSFTGLFVGRVGVGAGEAALTPVATSLISESFPRGRSATPMGLFAGSFYVGSGAALILGGALVQWLATHGEPVLPLVGAVKPWQAAFLLTGLPGLALAFLAFLMHDPREAARRAAAAAATKPADTVGFRKLLRERWQIVLFYMVGWGLLSSYFYATTAWTPAFAMRTFGWNTREVGTTIGLILATAGVAGSVLGGWGMDLMTRRGVKGATFLLTAILLGSALPFFLGAYLIGDPALMVPLLAIGFLLYSPMGAGAYASLPMVAPPGARGKVASLFVFMQAIFGAALGPAGVAVITDFVLRDEAKVGQALALYGAIVVPVGVISLIIGRRYVVAMEAAREAAAVP
jgi:MFS family permease